MTRTCTWSLTRIALVAFAMSCTDATGITPVELAQIVERDGVPFVIPSVPNKVLDRLSSHQLIIVGETHLIREHREMMAVLVEDLHARGFRQLLLEWPHLANWVLVDFVQDRQLEPDWKPPGWLYGDLITAIRDFNRTLPVDERVQVWGIDVNLQEYGGGDDFRASLRGLSHHLADPGPVDVFLQGLYDTPTRQTEQLGILRAALQSRQSELVAGWGAEWYDTVAEMVAVELESVNIRAMREDSYDESVRLREDAMKRFADDRLRGYEHGTLMNVGGNHAQKEHLKGTDQEWLGDYLVHRSSAVGGSVIVLAVTAARITSGGTLADYDLRDSPENELWRVMNETWPDQIVFLPLDDPVFEAGGVRMNFEGKIHVGAAKRHYDVFVLLPLAHRIALP